MIILSFVLYGGANAQATTITWTGASSSDWDDSTNWLPSVVPGLCAQNVVIPVTSNQPVIPGNTVIGKVTMLPGAVLTVNTELAVCGDWVGATASPMAKVIGPGKIVLNGMSQEIRNNTQFNTLSVRSPGVVSMAAGSNVDIIDYLLLENGVFETFNGTLTFKSPSSSKIGMLDDFSPGFVGEIHGPIVVERTYDAASYEEAHYMGVPLSGITTTMLGASNSTGGFITPASGCNEQYIAPGTLSGKVYTYDESHGISCSMAGWKVEVAGTPLQQAQGFSVRLTGAGTLTFTGAPDTLSVYSQTTGNSGWSNVTLQGRSVQSGWTLVSNPYLASLDFSTSAPTPDFDAIHAVWNVSGPYAGSYTDETVIAPFQAFFVRKTVPGGSSAYEIHKSDLSMNPKVFHALNNAETLGIYAQNNTTGLMDKTIVGYDANASANFDGAYDGIKIPGALNRHTLYTYNASPIEWYCKNIVKSIQETGAINIGFEPGVSGSYTFTFEGLQSFDPTSYIILEDKKLNVFHNVRSGPYTFSANATDDWHRFVIHFTPAAQISVTPSSCTQSGIISIQQAGNTQWAATLKDAQSNTVLTGQLNANSPLYYSSNPGLYTLTLTDNNGYTVVRNLMISGKAQLTAAIQADASTTDVNEDLGFYTYCPTGYSAVWDFGDGDLGYQNEIQHQYNAEGVYTVTLSISDNAGCTAVDSKVVSVTPAVVSGLNTTIQNNTFAVWPNPATDIINVSSNGTMPDGTIRILDQNGRVVSEVVPGSSANGKVSVEGLSKGIYYVQWLPQQGMARAVPFVKE